MRKKNFLKSLMGVSIMLMSFFTTAGFTEYPDVETVKEALASLQEALIIGEASKIEDILVTIPKDLPKAERAQTVAQFIQELKEASEEMITKMVETGGGPHLYLDYIMNSSFVRFEENGKHFGYRSFKVWLKEPGGRSGFVVFAEQNGRLLWHYGYITVPSWTRQPYDFSTPTKAFHSLRAAQSLGDALAIYNALASDLVEGMTFEEYMKKKRGIRSRFSYRVDDPLEAEFLTSQSGEERCRIWKLNEEGKRIGSETFIKEGGEWKWLCWRPKLYPKRQK